MQRKFPTRQRPSDITTWMSKKSTITFKRISDNRSKWPNEKKKKFGQIRFFEGLKVWWFEGLQVCKFTDLKIWKFEGLKVWRSEGLKVWLWRFEGLKVWRLEGLKAWKFCLKVWTSKVWKLEGLKIGRFEGLQVCKFARLQIWRLEDL